MFNHRQYFVSPTHKWTPNWRGLGLRVYLCAHPSQIEVQNVIDESPQRADVSELAIPESGEILDDVMDLIGLRHLLMLVFCRVCKSLVNLFCFLLVFFFN